MDLSYFEDILIVDDDCSELEDLSKVFLENMGCKVETCLYDRTEPPEEKYTGVKIAFFDLNITPDEIIADENGGYDWRTNKSASTAFNGLYMALKDVISLENEVYALIFWTNNEECIDSFKDYIKNRGVSDVPHPVYIGCLSKSEFGTSNDKPDLIKSLLKDTVFYKLMEFERVLHTEVQMMMFNILKIANEEGVSIWDNSKYHINLQSFLRTVASTHAGFERAKDNPSKSLTEALIPIITDKFIKSASKEKVWDELLDFNNVNKSDCKFTENNNLPRLNSLFHIDEMPKSFDTRGAVFRIENPKVFFKEKFDYSNQKRVIAETIVDFPRASREEIQFVLIEVSSACDYSQNKVRFNKYIVGLKLPKTCYDLYMEQLKVNSKALKQSVLDLKSSFFDESNDEYFNIFLNKNFVLTLNHNELDENNINHLFNFKKEMMDYIGNTYANHVSRIGTSLF